MINIVSHNKLLGHPVWLSQPLGHVSLQRGSEVQAIPRSAGAELVMVGDRDDAASCSASLMWRSRMLVPSEVARPCHHPALAPASSWDAARADAGAGDHPWDQHC